MKKIALVLMAVTAFAGQALAADMAVKARGPILAPAPVMTWTGFYVGINGGGAWMDGPSMTYVDLANTGNTTNSYAPSTINASSSSWLAGVHAGYNWQIAPTWVFGIEGDWDWTNLNASGTNRLFGATNLIGQTRGLQTDNVSLQTQVNWLASVRGRLGYASPNWMLYATGGVAFADMGFNAQVHCTGPVNGAGSLCGAPGQDIRPTGFNDTRVGWVAGAGFEFKPMSNWIFGLEYLYYGFDNTNTGGGSWTFPNGQPAPFYACTGAGQNCAQFSYGEMNVQTVRARLSYQFNWGISPVVAKY